MDGCYFFSFFLFFCGAAFKARMAAATPPPLLSPALDWSGSADAEGEDSYGLEWQLKRVCTNKNIELVARAWRGSPPPHPATPPPDPCPHSTPARRCQPPPRAEP